MAHPVEIQRETVPKFGTWPALALRADRETLMALSQLHAMFRKRDVEVKA